MGMSDWSSDVCSSDLDRKGVSQTMKRSGGQILVEQLRLHGVDTMFGVPGESFLAVLDALHDQTNHMKFVICRQEGGAAMMADAYGKTTGRPGICKIGRAHV